MSRVFMSLDHAAAAHLQLVSALQSIGEGDAADAEVRRNEKAVSLWKQDACRAASVCGLSRPWTSLAIGACGTLR